MAAVLLERAVATEMQHAALRQDWLTPAGAGAATGHRSTVDIERTQMPGDGTLEASSVPPPLLRLRTSSSPSDYGGSARHTPSTASNLAPETWRPRNSTIKRALHTGCAVHPAGRFTMR
ncbi:hypothetical protein Trco_007823 [Trichoderma cornu-damae]|uniref:Uncharacterized protein n=1 Tax=Trichoderma cornu-damae TaxID=654480 RepID=A0A9P8QL65_9HYPO|nr:hypothetical protein Trco_007823 [Trichoderma cornu-damae]